MVSTALDKAPLLMKKHHYNLSSTFMINCTMVVRTADIAYKNIPTESLTGKPAQVTKHSMQQLVFSRNITLGMMSQSGFKTETIHLI